MTIESIIVRRVPVEAILDLRHRILRAGLPPETARFEGDAEPTTHHLAAESHGRVVGCATILRRPWDGAPAWQLRGMAVEEDWQGKGVGRRLLEEAERLVRRERHSLQMWCNARTPATPFYRRLGWQTLGEEFVIPTAGPHLRMSKRLGRAD